MLKRIGVIGVGGVGGYFGAKLCRLLETEPDLELVFLARGSHLDQIRSNGLRVMAEGEPEYTVHPTLATDKISTMGPLDLVLLCVKDFDLDRVLSELSECIQPSTLILPLLNGVDVAARIREKIHSGIVFPGCVYIGTHIQQAGVIEQKGGVCKIFLGPDPEHPDFEPNELKELFVAAGIKHEWKEGVQSDIWQKFIFIAGYGIVTATFDKTLGEVLGDPGLKGEVRQIMQEATNLANGLGISLDTSIVEQSIEKGFQFPPETKTSFQRDFENPDKPDERRLFAGAIIEIGKRLGIDTPCTRRLYQVINDRKSVFWGAANE